MGFSRVEVFLKIFSEGPSRWWWLAVVKVLEHAVQVVEEVVEE